MVQKKKPLLLDNEKVNDKSVSVGMTVFRVLYLGVHGTPLVPETRFGGTPEKTNTVILLLRYPIENFGTPLEKIQKGR